MGVQKAPTDQQKPTQIMAVGGGSGPVSITMLKAQVGSTNVYQFNSDFQMVFGSGLCEFRQGGVYGLHAPLKSALLAASAPMTQL